MIPPPFLPPSQISHIPTSSAYQTPFEGNLYDKGKCFYNEQLYDEDGLLIYTRKENTNCLTRHQTLSSLKEKEDFLNWWHIVDTELAPSKKIGAELQTLSNRRISKNFGVSFVMSGKKSECF